MNIAMRDIAVKENYSFFGNSFQAIETIGLGASILDGYTRPVDSSEDQKRTVGKNIVAIRERLGLTQAQLADRLMVRQPSVWKLENSKGLPSAGTLMKLAKALPCAIEALVAGIDSDYDILRRRLTDEESSSRRSRSVTPKGLSLPTIQLAGVPAAVVVGDQRDTTLAARQDGITTALNVAHQLRETATKLDTLEHKDIGRTLTALSRDLLDIAAGSPDPGRQRPSAAPDSHPSGVRGEAARHGRTGRKR